MAPAFAFARRWRQYLGPAQVEEWRRKGAMEIFHYGENRSRCLSYALMEDADRYEESPITQPALIFHGEQDDVVPVEFSIQFAAAHPNTQLDILYSGHELIDVLERWPKRHGIPRVRPQASPGRRVSHRKSA